MYCFLYLLTVLLLNSQSILEFSTRKKEKALYNVKVATVRLKSIPGKHRIIESVDPVKQSTKYLLTNQLTWEDTKIISDYSHRWIMKEFFRNAKQLSDMEGATNGSFNSSSSTI